MSSRPHRSVPAVLVARLGGAAAVLALGVALALPAQAASTLSESRRGGDAAATQKTRVPPRPLVLDPVPDDADTPSRSKSASGVPKAKALLAAGGALGLAALSLLARRLLSRRST